MAALPGFGLSGAFSAAFSTAAATATATATATARTAAPASTTVLAFRLALGKEEEMIE
jgi:hypothetical protein